MSTYKIFSKYYDKIMGDRSNYLIFINNIINKYNPNARKILDVACGTGKILATLDEKYEKYGVDLSKEMLELAKKNVKKGTFFCQDMKDISLNNKFDLIINVFDSINHLTNFNDWKKTFKNTYDLLNEDGVFLFDINTISKLKKVSEYKLIMYEINNDIIFFKTENKGNGIINWNIKFFENKINNNYDLFQENIEETSFEIEEVRKSLSNFSKVIIVDENNNTITENTERAFFICIK